MSDSFKNSDYIFASDESIDLNAIIGNLDISPSYTINTGGTYSITSPYNVTGVWSSTTNPYIGGAIGAGENVSVSLGQDGIQVREHADIKLGDVSLKDFIKSIEERLAILIPNPKLENEWEELKELGIRYRALEQEIKDKMKTWDILSRDDQAGK